MENDIIINNKFKGISRSVDSHKIVFYCLKENLNSLNDIIIDLDSYLVIQGDISTERDIIVNNTLIVDGSINAGRNIVGDLNSSSIMLNHNIKAKGHIQTKEIISKEGCIEAGTYIYVNNSIKALKSVSAINFIRSKKINCKSIKTITLKCSDIVGDTTLVTNMSSDSQNFEDSLNIIDK